MSIKSAEDSIWSAKKQSHMELSGDWTSAVSRSTSNFRLWSRVGGLVVVSEEAITLDSETESVGEGGGGRDLEHEEVSMLFKLPRGLNMLCCCCLGV